MSKLPGITQRRIDVLVPENSLKCTVVQKGVYKLTHKKSGKIYIGSTSNLYERVHAHATDLLSGSHKNRNLQDCFNDSKDFSLEFTEMNESTRDLRIEVEQSEIDNLVPTGKLLNIALDARAPWSGQKRPSSVSEAVSKANRERIHSPESRQKMSQSRKGTKMSLDSILKARETRGLGKVIVDGVEFLSLPDADKKLGLVPGTTRRRVASQSPQYSGYVVEKFKSK